MSQRLRLSDSVKGISQNGLDKVENPERRFAIRVDPPT
jgi:hypothetical protein